MAADYIVYESPTTQADATRDVLAFTDQVRSRGPSAKIPPGLKAISTFLALLDITVG